MGRHVKRPMLIITATVILTIAAAGRAPAAIITYDFTGSVTTVTDNGNFALNGTIPLGTAVTGGFSYDTATPGVPLDANATEYPGAPVAFSTDVGGLLTFSPASLNYFDPSVIVRNDAEFVQDQFRFSVGEQPPTGLTLPAGATTSEDFAFVAIMALRDTSGAVFSSTAIPTTLDLGAFTTARLLLMGGRAEAGGISFPGEIDVALTSLTLQPVPAIPQPASLALLATGLVGLLGYGRGRARRRPRVLD